MRRVTRQVTLAAGALLLAVLVGTVGYLWHFERSANPALRPPESWTLEDLRTIFYNPTLHWCAGAHGHVPGRGWKIRCKGHPAVVFSQIRRRPRNRELEELVIGLIDEPDSEVASRAAEVSGRWSLSEAASPLTRRVANYLQKDVRNPTEDEFVESAAWALEHLKAHSAVDVLKPQQQWAGGFRVHAIAVLESRTICTGPCNSPHGM